MKFRKLDSILKDMVEDASTRIDLISKSRFIENRILTRLVEKNYELDNTDESVFINKMLLGNDVPLEKLNTFITNYMITGSRIYQHDKFFVLLLSLFVLEELENNKEIDNRDIYINTIKMVHGNRPKYYDIVDNDLFIDILKEFKNNDTVLLLNDHDALVSEGLNMDIDEIYDFMLFKDTKVLGNELFHYFINNNIDIPYDVLLETIIPHTIDGSVTEYHDIFKLLDYSDLSRIVSYKNNRSVGSMYAAMLESRNANKLKECLFIPITADEINTIGDKNFDKILKFTLNKYKKIMKKKSKNKEYKYSDMSITFLTSNILNIAEHYKLSDSNLTLINDTMKEVYGDAYTPIAKK